MSAPEKILIGIDDREEIEGFTPEGTGIYHFMTAGMGFIPYIRQDIHTTEITALKAEIERTLGSCVFYPLYKLCKSRQMV